MKNKFLRPVLATTLISLLLVAFNVGASGGYKISSAVLPSGTTGQILYYASNGTNVTATSSMLIGTDGTVTFAAGIVAPQVIIEGIASSTYFRVSSGDASNLSLAFGDGDTGFFENTDDTLIVSIGGVSTYLFNSSRMGATNVGEPVLLNEITSAANPNIIPNLNDIDTGVGAAADDQLSLIAGGVEGIRISEDTTIDVKVNGTLTANNNTWLRGLDFAGTGYVNMFKVNASNEIELGGVLTNLGTYTFEADSGAVTAMNMPVSATPSAGTAQSFSHSIDSNPLFTVYAEADGAGGIQNQGIGIGTTTPGALLDVYNTATSTLMISSDSATQGACIKLRDSDGAGWSYCVILNGTLSCGTDSCE